MSTPHTERRPPPYAPYRSWKNLVEKLKGKRPLPAPFDAGFWNSLGFSGALVGVLRPSMSALGLLENEGKPTERLNRLLDADGQPGEIYQEMMDVGFPGWSQRFDIDRATSGQLASYFAELGVTGDTVAKCKSFFIGLAGDASLTISPHLTTRSSTGSAKSPRRIMPTDQERKAASSRKKQSPLPPPPSTNTQQEVVELTSGGKMTITLDTNMWQLSPDDETFLLDIKHRIREYNQARGSQGKNGPSEVSVSPDEAS